MFKTKMDFAFAFIEMLNTKKMKDISVSALCKKSNYSRETFYYHFKDKYDLIAWMHSFEKHSFFSTYLGSEAFSQTIQRILEDMKKIDIFYIRGFEESPAIQFEEMMAKQTIKVYRDMTKHLLKQDYLPLNLELSIRHNVYGSVMVAKDWLLHDNSVTEKQLAEFITDSMQENLKEILIHSLEDTASKQVVNS